MTTCALQGANLACLAGVLVDCPLFLGKVISVPYPENLCKSSSAAHSKGIGGCRLAAHGRQVRQLSWKATWRLPCSISAAAMSCACSECP